MKEEMVLFCKKKCYSSMHGLAKTMTACIMTDVRSFILLNYSQLR